MRTESGNKLSYFPHLGLSGRQSRLDQNLTKLSPILSWPHCGTAAQTNQEKYSRKIKWRKISIEYNLLWIIPHHSPWSSLWWQLRGFSKNQLTFKESQIQNESSILDSEMFWMNLSWKNAIGIGKMSLRRRFYKVEAGSPTKRRGLLGTAKLFTCESNDWIVEARMYIWALQSHQPYCSS